MMPVHESLGHRQLCPVTGTALTGATASIEKNVALENVIATTDNADDPEVSKYFYKEDCT
jgi:hypothetical protein